jgi:hypothetical protein
VEQGRAVDDTRPARPGPDRRRVLTVSATGIAAMALPTAAAAATGAEPQGAGLTAPTGVTAEPIGYIGSSTGAIRVTWTSVAGATGYDVGWATTSNGTYTFEAAGATTSHDLTGLAGTDTTHYLVVRATDGSIPSLNSDEATSSPVIATGGTITTFDGNGTVGTAGVTYVVHTFASVGTDTFTLNRSRDLDYLVVGGGGAGGSAGADTSSGGGGGGQVIASELPGASGAFDVDIGAGGAATAVVDIIPSGGAAADGGTSSLTVAGGAPVATARGGGGGASAAIGSGNQGPASTTGWTGGGGATHADHTSAGSTGVGGVGVKGGDPFGSGTDADVQAAGGGGGAGGPGANAASSTGGAGGAGATSSITGTDLGYGGGGGGGKRILNGSVGVGNGGGGDGGLSAAGTPGTRGGGGGGAGDANAGGDGGSGIVIVRYALPD